MERCILHCDLNNFYASVECLYKPEIRERPVAVCGSKEDRHGIVLAKNYIAKKYGVQTGEAIWQAKNKCPNLLVVPPNFGLYLNFSAAAKEIYRTYTDSVESFGIDECWLDVSSSTSFFGGGEKIAREIQRRIREELGVTVSIGVSFNKIFAKLGSDMKKPDAITVITQENFKDKIWPLPAEEMIYVGRATKRKLNRAAIFTIKDLAIATPAFLVELLGKWGQTLWNFANGYDQVPVSKEEVSPYIKSVGNSLTTPYDLADNQDVKVLLYVLSESVGERLRRYKLKGKTVQISIRDNGLFSIERQAKLEVPTFTTRDIAKKAYRIFLDSWDWQKDIRSLGVRMCDLSFPEDVFQMPLFYDDGERRKLESLDSCLDKIRERYGHYAVQRGLLFQERSKKLNHNPIEENVIFPVSYFKDGVGKEEVDR